jgi:predicted nucleotidyltransferase
VKLGCGCKSGVNASVAAKTRLEADWNVTPEKVRLALQRLIEAAQPRKIFFFGSYARGRTSPDSDLDVLVVSHNNVENPRAESVRLRRALRGIPMAMDILVVPENLFEAHRQTPGLIYREAIETGRLVYDATR